MKGLARWLAGLVMAGLLFGGGALLLHTGLYGLTVFVVIPFFLGMLASWTIDARTMGQAVGAGMCATGIACLLLLAGRMEGAICILMASPLLIVVGGIGGLLAYRSRGTTGAPGVAMMLLAPTATMGWDVNAKPPVFRVHTAIEIAATPEQVWKHVVTFSEIPEPREWFFRAGVAYPMRARIEGTGPGAIRYCEFSTGPFVEPIDVWNEPRLLSFHVTHNPAPLNEWSPYGRLVTKHLHGYFVSQQGEFRLTPLGKNRTLLEGNSWYRHGLWPAQYWRWWSDAIIRQIHLRVLEHIRALAEADSAASVRAAQLNGVPLLR